MAHLQTSALISAPLNQVFDYVTNLKHLPEWLGDKIQASFSTVPPQMKMGVEYSIQMTRFGVKCDFLFRIEQYLPNELFIDKQLQGFFAHWVHTQKLEEHDSSKTHLIDIIEYALPYGLLGSLADDLFFHQDLEQIMKRRYLKIQKHFDHGED